MIPRLEKLELAKSKSGSGGSCAHLLWSVSTSEHRKGLVWMCKFFHCVVKICWLLVTRNGHIRKLLLPSFIVFDDVYENCGLLARYKKNCWVMNIHVYLYFPSVIILNVIHMFSKSLSFFVNNCPFCFVVGVRYIYLL